jgi:hypothetical protein
LLISNSSKPESEVPLAQRDGPPAKNCAPHQLENRSSKTHDGTDLEGSSA